MSIPGREWNPAPGMYTISIPVEFLPDPDEPTEPMPKRYLAVSGGRVTLSKEPFPLRLEQRDDLHGYRILAPVGQAQAS